MKAFVFRGKYIFLLCIAAAAVLGAFLGSRAAVVFKGEARKIPIYSVRRTDKLAGISFNCAWNASDIDSILKTLKQYDVRATFFIVGDWAEKYPEALKKIHEAGHEVGGHSYNHMDYAKLSAAEIEEDIKKCDSAIEAVTGKIPVLYRVPSGSYNNNAVSALEKSGKTVIQWSCDSIDYNDASASDIYERSVKLEAGGILLMHNGTKSTAAALPRILDTLCRKYKPVPVGELIYDSGYAIDQSGEMYLK